MTIETLIDQLQKVEILEREIDVAEVIVRALVENVVEVLMARPAEEVELRLDIQSKFLKSLWIGNAFYI